MRKKQNKTKITTIHAKTVIFILTIKAENSVHWINYLCFLTNEFHICIIRFSSLVTSTKSSSIYIIAKSIYVFVIWLGQGQGIKSYFIISPESNEETNGKRVFVKIKTDFTSKIKQDNTKWSLKPKTKKRTWLLLQTITLSHLHYWPRPFSTTPSILTHNWSRVNFNTSIQSRLPITNGLRKHKPQHKGLPRQM